MMLATRMLFAESRLGLVPGDAEVTSEFAKIRAVRRRGGVPRRARQATTEEALRSD